MAIEAERLVVDSTVNVAVDEKRIPGWHNGASKEDNWLRTEKGDDIFTRYCNNVTVNDIESLDFPENVKGRLIVADNVQLPAKGIDGANKSVSSSWRLLQRNVKQCRHIL